MVDNAPRLAKSLIRNIENTMKEIDTIPVIYLFPEQLMDQFKIYDSLTSKLARLTYNGELPPNLRKALPKVISWLENHEKILEEEGSKRRKKKVLLDLSDLERFKGYAEKVQHYFEDTFPDFYSSLEEDSEDINSKFDYLKKNLDKFMLKNMDVIDPDYLAADDADEDVEDVDLVEPKSIKDIKSLINKFASFIKKVNTLRTDIDRIGMILKNLDVGDLLDSLNKRNFLVQSLLKNLANLNRVFYQGNLDNNLLIREKYNELLDNVLSKYTFLPNNISSRLMEYKPSQADEAVERSIGGARERMGDPIDTFVSPFARRDVALPDDDIYEVPDEKIEYVREPRKSFFGPDRPYEQPRRRSVDSYFMFPLSRDPEEVLPQLRERRLIRERQEREGFPAVPGGVTEDFPFSKDERLSQKEREEYEKLWSQSSLSAARNKLYKVASYIFNKYS